MHRLGVEGFDPVPGRTSIYRCLVRHRRITPEARPRKRSDYKRWERSKAMELWQVDALGGVRLDDGSEAKVITGIDDNSRFCVSAFVVARAIARPTCDALIAALGRHGAPAAPRRASHQNLLEIQTKQRASPGSFSREFFTMSSLD